MPWENYLLIHSFTGVFKYQNKKYSSLMFTPDDWPIMTTISDNVLRCLMVSHKVSCCHLVPIWLYLMVSHNVLWCLIIPHNVSWCLIVSHNVSWCLMVSYKVSMSQDVLWCLKCLMRSHGASWCWAWCFLESHDVSCGLMGFHGISDRSLII